MLARIGIVLVDGKTEMRLVGEYPVDAGAVPGIPRSDCAVLVGPTLGRDTPGIQLLGYPKIRCASMRITKSGPTTIQRLAML